MSNLIYCENASLKMDSEMESVLGKLGRLTKIDCSENWEDLKAFLGSEDAKKGGLVFLPQNGQTDSALGDLLKDHPLQSNVVWVSQDIHQPEKTEAAYSFFSEEDLKSEDMVQNISRIFRLERTLGIKNFLNEKSTIFCDALFDPSQITTKLEPCFVHAKKELPEAALKIVSTFSALIFEAFVLMQNVTREDFKESESEKVDLQYGVDDEVLCIGVRFQCEHISPQELLDSFFPNKNHNGSQWVMAMRCANILEIRRIQSSGEIEVNAIFNRKNIKQSNNRPLIVRVSQDIPLEDGKQDYDYRPFAELNNSRLKKMFNFRKKFTEIVEEDVEPKAGVETKQERAIDEEILESALGEDVAATTEKFEKKIQLLESKIQGLAETLQQREELIKSLNKQIEEEVDPLKRDAVSSVVDNQKQGLADNIKRLEEALSEAEAREKELMSMVDKAIQARDETNKKLKIADSKLQTAESGNNSKIVTLEKQLAQAEKQRGEMSKRMAELMKKVS